MGYSISTDDLLEVRIAKGEIEITQIYNVHKDLIETEFGKFKITGNKNQAGDEIYQHVTKNGDYSDIHAVLADDEDSSVLELTLLYIANEHYSNVEEYCKSEGSEERAIHAARSCKALCDFATYPGSGVTRLGESQLQEIATNLKLLVDEHSILKQATSDYYL